MPNSWKKNAKYFDTSQTHSDYTLKKNDFRRWKKKMKLKDNHPPFNATCKGDKNWVPPTDYLCGYSSFYNQYNFDVTPLSDEDHQNWCLYLKSWKQKMSNQTFRHKGCRPDCRLCNPKLWGLSPKFRKNIDKQVKIDFSIKTKPSIDNSKSKSNFECTICYEKKPEHSVIGLSCTRGQKNKNYVCKKCRKEIYLSEFNTCPLCRKHPI